MRERFWENPRADEKGVPGNSAETRKTKAREKIKGMQNFEKVFWPITWKWKFGRIRHLS